eukprot:751172-Hanusia_phi.AAC.8
MRKSGEERNWGTGGGQNSKGGNEMSNSPSLYLPLSISSRRRRRTTKTRTKRIVERAEQEVAYPEPANFSARTGEDSKDATAGAEPASIWRSCMANWWRVNERKERYEDKKDQDLACEEQKEDEEDEERIPRKAQGGTAELCYSSPTSRGKPSAPSRSLHSSSAAPPAPP